MNFKQSLFVFGTFLLACQPSPTVSNVDTVADKESLFKASEFTADSLFTSGIEGPAVALNGTIYAVNYQQQGTIGQVNPNGKASLFISLPKGSIGNGIRLDHKGHMYIADYKQHNVLLVDIASKEISVFAHNATMNQPNDLAIHSNGTLFASDPNWSNSTGQIWRITPDGTTYLLESGMGTTNGIEINPNENKLYVNTSVQREVWQYDLSPDGQISNKQLLHQFADFGMDGMRCDMEGNLYITRYGKGTVAIISPAGKLIREVSLPGTKPSNITFGGQDGRTCYVTLQDRGMIASFRSNKPGREWMMLHTPSD